ncbi:MAG: mechanosensitive ion channel domain-containing protein [Chlamydiota bacterium]
MMKKFNWKYLFIITLAFLAFFTYGKSSTKDVKAMPISQQEAIDNNAPHPLKLEPGWAGYFDVPPQDLPQRINNLSDKLNVVQAEVDPAISRSVTALVEKINKTLQAIPEFRSKTAVQLPDPTSYKEIYSLEMQLKIVDDIYELEQKVKVEKKEIAAKNERLLDIESNINKLMASYLSQEAKSSEKLLTGLNIMSQEASFMVLKEELRLLKARLEAHEAQLANLNDELEVSLTKFVLRPLDFEKLQNEINEFSLAISNIRDKLPKMESALTAAPFETELQRAERQLLRLELLAEKINLAYQETSLMFLEVKRSLYQAWLYGEDIDISQLNNFISQTNNSLVSIALKRKEFQAIAQQAQIETGQVYANLLLIPDIKRSLVEDLYQRQIEETNKIFSTLKLLEIEIRHAKQAVTQLEVYLKPYTTTYQRWIDTAYDWSGKIYNAVVDFAYYSFFTIGNVPITLMVIFKVCLIIVVALFISRLMRNAINNLAKKRKDFSESNIFTIGILIHYIILFIAILFAISSMGLDLSSLAIILGALSVGIGFGLQGIVNNFLCGLLLLFTRNIKVGDYIQLDSDLWGKVISINVQNTIIQTYDGTEVIVPNSEMVVHKTTNWTMKHGYIRLHVPFGVAYGSDKDLVKKAALEAADRVSLTVKNSAFFADPNLWLTGFGDNALNFELVVWVSVYGRGHRGGFYSSYLWEIETSLREHNITIPFPQRDLYLKSVPDNLVRQQVEN